MKASKLFCASGPHHPSALRQRQLVTDFFAPASPQLSKKFRFYLRFLVALIAVIYLANRGLTSSMSFVVVRLL
jgi:hypothetical protein